MIFLFLFFQPARFTHSRSRDVVCCKMRDELSIITVKIAIHDLFCLMYSFCIIQFTVRFFSLSSSTSSSSRLVMVADQRRLDRFGRGEVGIQFFPLSLFPGSSKYNVNKLWSINSKLLSGQWKLSNYKPTKNILQRRLL